MRSLRALKARHQPRRKGDCPGGSDFASLAVMQGIQDRRGISHRIYHALLERRVDAAVSVVSVDAGTVGRHKESSFSIYSQAQREGKVFCGGGGV